MHYFDYFDKTLDLKLKDLIYFIFLNDSG